MDNETKTKTLTMLHEVLSRNEAYGRKINSRMWRMAIEAVIWPDAGPIELDELKSLYPPELSKEFKDNQSA